MAFLNPTLAFAALACIAAPIIIHLLFRRKRTPMEWGAMKFVLEAFKRHRKRLRLEQILLLLARTLAVLFLALAVGRPMLAGSRPADSRRARDLTIVIDNSLASQARTGGAEGARSELEIAKGRAAQLLDELDAGRGDRATIVTLAAPAERLLSAPSGDLAGVRRVLDQVESGDSGADFAGASALAREAAPSETAEGSRESTIALLSSLRAGSVDLSRENESARAGGESMSGPVGTVAENQPTVLAMLPATENIENVAIVGVEPLRSMMIRAGQDGATQQARVTLRRFGEGVERPASVRLRLRVTDGRQGDDEKAWESAVVGFAPGEDSATVLAPVAVRVPKNEAAPTASWIEARIDDDAIASDNVFRRPWRVREQVRVAVIAPADARDAETGPAGYSGADWLTLALSPAGAARGIDLESENDPIRISRMDPARLAASDLAGVDAAFITRPDLLDAPSWPLLNDFARRGGLLVVCASPLEGVQRWTDGFVRATGIAWVFDRESETFGGPNQVRALTGANADQPIIAALGADLTDLIKPVVASRLLGVDLKGDGSWLMRFDDRRPMIATTRPGSVTGTAGEQASGGRGLIVAFFVAPELSWTNLPAMPLMVPLIQEIVRQGVGLASGSAEVVAGGTLEAPDELRTVEPKEAGSAGAIARRTGVWRRVDAQGVTKDVVAVNADTRGSSTAAQQKARLEPFLRNWVRGRELVWHDPAAASGGGGAGALGAARRTPPIDLPLLLAGLCLLIADVVFSRVFSHATVRADRVQGAELGSRRDGEEMDRGVAA